MNVEFQMDVAAGRDTNLSFQPNTYWFFNSNNVDKRPFLTFGKTVSLT